MRSSHASDSKLSDSVWMGTRITYFVFDDVLSCPVSCSFQPKLQDCLRVNLGPRIYPAQGIAYHGSEHLQGILIAYLSLCGMSAARNNLVAVRTAMFDAVLVKLDYVVCHPTQMCLPSSEVRDLIHRIHLTVDSYAISGRIGKIHDRVKFHYSA